MRGDCVPRKKLSRDAEEALRKGPWPGNVRELENLMERVMDHAAEGDGEENARNCGTAMQNRKEQEMMEVDLNFDQRSGRLCAGCAGRGEKERGEVIL
jgi:DNA-binding NtrC family response regulator